MRKKHSVSVIVPDSGLENGLDIRVNKGVEVIRVSMPSIKNKNYFKRTFFELIMPFIIYINLSKKKLVRQRYDGIVWYSPSIFFGPLIYLLKRHNSCKTYLILRDIFPKWALDMGIIRKSFPYYFFKLNERFQYSVANTIGYQSKSNSTYIEKFIRKDQPKTELLHNWLTRKDRIKKCSVSIEDTNLSRKKNICLCRKYWNCSGG